MASQALPCPSFADDLAFDRAAEGKHEYLGGEIFAVGGAGEPHHLIVANLVAQLR